jgi:hypothetical protein
VLDEGLAGGPAFPADGDAPTPRAHCFDPVEPPSKRRGEPLPAVLEAAVMKCLEKERANRFETADDLCAALRSHSPVRLSGQIAMVRPPMYESVHKPKSRVLVMLPAFAMAAAALAIQLWPRSQEGAIAATAPPEPTAVVKMPAMPPADPPRADAPKPLPPASVTLQLASKPAGAQIFVGDKAIGTAPLSTTLVMSSEIVTLVAKFPDGSEVTQTVVPDRPLPEVVFVQKKPAVAATPTKRTTKASTQKPQTKKTPSSSSSQNRDDTMDPFKK